MKRPSTYLQKHPNMEVQMTPMIDMVFLLLIYFVCNSGFQTPEQTLDSALHVEAQGASVVAAPPERPELPPLMIRIHWLSGEPRWEIDAEPVTTLTEVGASLRATARVKRDLAVIVDPDADVPLAHVMDVYDLARQAGLERVQFAALADGTK